MLSIMIAYPSRNDIEKVGRFDSDAVASENR